MEAYQIIELVSAINNLTKKIDALNKNLEKIEKNTEDLPSINLELREIGNILIRS